MNSDNSTVSEQISRRFLWAIVVPVLTLSIAFMMPTQGIGQSKVQPVRKKTPVKPTMAARSGVKGTRTRTDSGRKAAGSKMEVSTGEPVRPSEFNGDVKALPQNVTTEERLRFSERPEFEREPPIKKKPLPGAQPETPAQDIVPMAPMPNPGITFDGMNFNSNGAGHPPDTVGDVGPNHYVQAVNTSIGIYNKTTGAAISTFTFNSLWSGAGTGTPCDTANQGDPTVVYSSQYNRFIIGDFSWSDIQNGPYYECVAVSKTADPSTGGWWLYAIRADDAAHPWLPDYPKMSVWSDGLYMSSNMFDCLNAGCGSASYKEARAYAFNLSKMVNGTALAASDVQFADTTSARFTLLPSNYRGTAPPAGRPNYFVEESGTAFSWNVFKFHIDFVTPANSTFTGPTAVSQSTYSVAASVVPEPAPGNNSDTLADRMMMQVQYKNLAGVESLWVNHTTGTASASTPTGIQWAQINVTGGTVSTTPVQQQIFNNGADGLNRFMGSLAVDKDGNMALGYTASSSSVAPDIRYVGRLSTDTLNTLPQTEITMLPSVTRSVQAGNCGGSPCTRWGDYSAMTLDPNDNCTFWYTHLYFPVQGLNWVTRIGSFKFPTCISSPTAAEVAVSGRVLTRDGNGLANASVLITDMKGVTRTVISSSLGYFRFENIRAGETYIVSVSSKRFQFLPQTVNVSDELTGLDLTAEP
jgi:hypothetical protein